MNYVRSFFHKIDFVGRNHGKPKKSFIDSVKATRWSSLIGGLLLMSPAFINGFTHTGSHPTFALWFSIALLTWAFTVAFLKLYTGKHSR